jgi:predicted negative regulator of RcsB-dependent stress response
LIYLVTITFYLGLCLAVSLATRRLTNPQMRMSHNDVAGFIFTTVGAIYGVLLAFITVIVWDNYNKVAENADKEAVSALAMYRNLSLYPDQEQAGKVAQSLVAFIHSTVDDEYSAMAQMKKSPATQQAMDLLWANTRKLKPQNFQEQVLFTEIIKDLNNIAQLRSERLVSAYGSKLTGVMRHTIMLRAISL